jgi:hypothetical protein
MKRSLLALLLVLFLCCGSTAQAVKSAQVSEAKVPLTGAVYDVNGAVIVGAVVVASRSDGKSYEGKTDAEGGYRLSVPPGEFSVEVSAPGFCPSQIEGFRVVNSTLGKMSLDFVLEVGATHIPCKHKMTVESGRDNKANKDSKIIID